jgi:FXSXX-COOH protein
MAESVIEAGSGLLDLSATPLADLPGLDAAALEAAVGRLIQSCGAVSDDTTVIGGHVRMWQNYRIEH